MNTQDERLQYPTPEEVDAYIREGHRLRAEAVAALFSGLFKRRVVERTAPSVAAAKPAV